jgi:hypothetical protein
MSRSYEMTITISNFKPAKKKAIIEACRNDWEFEDENCGEESGTLTCFGQSFLGGGETEEEFADHIAGEIWEANGEFCNVLVTSTYLEDLPSEEHECGLQDYRKWLKTKKAA